jgi:hypothetical protein
MPMIIALLALAAAQPADTTPFPLVEGASWIYRGTVSVAAGRSSRSRAVVQTMRIARVWPVGSLTAALVAGHPADLVWADSRAPRQVRLVVRTPELRWYQREVDSVGGLPSDSLVQSLAQDPDAQFLQWPLFPETRFGAPLALARPDGWYAWRVSDVRQEAAGRVRYRLERWTLPDTEIIDVVPGVGITRFHYHHHGTPMVVDLRLVGRAQR